MDPVTVGIIGIAGLIILFLLGMPIAFAMAISGFIGFAYLTSWDAAFTVVARDFFEEFSSYPLSVIPMFILMGTFASASGISRRLYRTAYAWMGHWRGGLAIATIFACAGFGAICGSSTATAAAMGKIALPEMKRYGYEDSFATGTVAAGGTLGILIPPSTVLIIYGILTEQSIGKLFVAGILPGLLLSAFFALTAFLVCKFRPHYAPSAEPLPWSERLRAVSGVVEILILFLLALGGSSSGGSAPPRPGP